MYRRPAAKDIASPLPALSNRSVFGQASQPEVDLRGLGNSDWCEAFATSLTQQKQQDDGDLVPAPTTTPEKRGGAANGVQRQTGARAAQGLLRQVCEIRLDSLDTGDEVDGGALSATATCLRTQAEQCGFPNVASRAEYLFPTAIWLLHPYRVAILLYATIWFVSGPSLVAHSQVLVKAINFLLGLFNLEPIFLRAMETTLSLLMTTKRSGSKVGGTARASVTFNSLY
jgi:hypothetical protein